MTVTALDNCQASASRSFTLGCAVDEAKACVLAARNLALAEQQGNRPILAPCAACYLVLNKTKHYLHESPSVHQVVNQALKVANLTYSGNTPVRHPLDVLVHSVGLEAIRKAGFEPGDDVAIALDVAATGAA